jgi:N-acetylglucosamine kinase-like BadF-type ATPase
MNLAQMTEPTPNLRARAYCPVIKITVAFFLGIDSGGSKTTCAIGDESSLLATATAGPSNVVRVGESQARESLHQSVRQACAAAGITPQQVAGTCIGAAGAVRAEIISTVRAALAEILPTAIDVVGDMEIALDAAFHDGPGVIVIAGTGSIAYGRDALGNTVRAGGWGFAISDEGSAHWIGRAAIAAVLRAKDSGEVTPDGNKDVSPPLLAALLKAWGMASLDDFLRAANSTPPPDFAALFPALLTAVQVNDELAQHILTQAGQELAGLAAIVIRRLQARSTPLSDPSEVRPSESQVVKTPVRLAIAGGVFRHAPLVREVFYNEVRRLHPLAEVDLQIVKPVEGALRLARRAASSNVVNDCEQDVNRKVR